MRHVLLSVQYHNDMLVLLESSGSCSTAITQAGRDGFFALDGRVINRVLTLMSTSMFLV